MKNIASFNTIRFFLAVFILWHHTGIIFFGNEYEYNKYFRTAHLAVDCFFILSGFLMTKSFYSNVFYSTKNIGVGSFFWGRIKRLYPEFIFCLIVIYFFLKIFHIPKSSETFLLEAIMLGGMSNIPSILTVVWFISVLFWLSCFIYCIVFFFKEKGLFLIIPTLGILSFFILVANFNSIAGHSQPLLANFLSYGVIRGMLGLSVGIFVYIIVVFINKTNWDKYNKNKINIIFILLEFLCIFEFIRLLSFRKNGGIDDFNIYFVFSFLVVLLFYKKEFFLKFLSNPLLAKLGAISYIFYLSHVALLDVLKKYSIFLEMNLVLMYACVTISCSIFATILYFLYKQVSSLLVKFITIKRIA